ncbi:MAG: ABC transporter substrate-binding protein [Desulfotalea sp.]
MKKIVSLVVFLSVFSMFVGGASAGDTLNYRLKWLFNSSVAGDIYADKMGYFTKVGLKVKVKEGGPEKDAIKELELGQADFGVASADQVMRAIDKGSDVVVIAQIFQINPMQWIYRSNLPQITKLEQLNGQKIGYTFGGNDETIMKTLLAKTYLTPKDIKLTGARFDFTPFLTKKVDFWPVYRNSQGVILEDKLKKNGEGVQFFNPADFGVNFVANSVVTSRKMWDNNRPTVEKFHTALMEAWTDAMNPANEANVLATLAKVDKGNNDDIRRKQLQVTRDLVAPDGRMVGVIDVDSWEQTVLIMLENHQIKNAIDIVEHIK